jgi:hypothetical protein
MNVEIGRQNKKILRWKYRGRAVSFLEPDIYIGFSPAHHLPCGSRDSNLSPHKSEALAERYLNGRQFILGNYSFRPSTSRSLDTVATDSLARGLLYCQSSSTYKSKVMLCRKSFK